MGRKAQVELTRRDLARAQEEYLARVREEKPPRMRHCAMRTALILAEVAFINAVAREIEEL